MTSHKPKHKLWIVYGKLNYLKGVGQFWANSGTSQVKIWPLRSVLSKHVGLGNNNYLKKKQLLAYLQAAQPWHNQFSGISSPIPPLVLVPIITHNMAKKLQFCLNSKTWNRDSGLESKWDTMHKVQNITIGDIPFSKQRTSFSKKPLQPFQAHYKIELQR